VKNQIELMDTERLEHKRRAVELPPEDEKDDRDENKVDDPDDDEDDEDDDEDDRGDDGSNGFNEEDDEEEGDGMTLETTVERPAGRKPARRDA
jgi:hypothetical protein